MPAEQGDAERFAAAEEQGRSPRSVADPGLARDLEIAAMLRSAGAAVAPSEDERSRVRARMMAGLAAGAAGPVGPPMDEITRKLMALRRPTAPASVDAATTVLPVRAAAETSPVRDPAPPATAQPATAQPATAQPATALTDTALPDTARPGRRSRGGRHTLPSRPAPRAHGARHPSPLRRAVFAGAAALLALVAVTGGSIAASRNALPGDALYGVKRAAESVGNAVTLSQTAKAQRNLDSAITRLDEVRTLTQRDPASILDPQVVRATMQDFDASTSDGARTLLTAQNVGNTGELAQLHTWASDQVTKVTSLRGSLPQAAQPGADRTITLLDRLIGRTDSLAARSSCEVVASGSDDLGPLPATTPCTPATSDDGQQQPATSAPGTTRAQSVPGSTTPTTVPGSAVPTSAPDGVVPPPAAGGDPADGDEPDPTEATDTPSPTTRTVLPGLPRIYLPPLLPGGKGITID